MATCGTAVSGNVSLRGASSTVERVRAWAVGALSVVAAAQAFPQPVVSLGRQRVLPGDLAFLAAVGLGAALFVVERGRVLAAWRAAARPLAALAAWAAALTLATFTGEGPPHALKLVGSLGLAALPALALLVVDDEASLRRVTGGWLWGALGCAAVGAATLATAALWPAAPWLRWTLADQGSLPYGGYPRLQSTFLNPNMLCTYLTLSLALLAGAAREGWLRPGPARGLGALVGLALAFTLSAGLGAVALLGAALSKAQGARRLAVRGAAAALALLAFAATWVTWGAPLRPSGRLLTWLGAWDTFSRHPLLGAGWGTAPCHVTYAHVSGPLLTFTDAHNVLLSVGAQAGVVGLAALGWVLWESSAALRGAPARPLAWASALGVALVFGYQGLSGAYEDARHLWLALGLALSSQRLARTTAEAARLRPPAAP